MITEGRGMTAPKPVTTTMSEHDMRACAIEAKKRAAYRGYAGGDSWERGMCGGVVLPSIGVSLTAAEKPIYAGCLSECALAYWGRGRGLDAYYSWQLMLHGDGGRDVRLEALECNVKARYQCNPVTLVRCVRHDGSLVPVRGHVLVACQIKAYRIVHLLGWIRMSAVRDMPPVPAWRGHKNHEVSDLLLEPMCGLADLARATAC